MRTILLVLLLLALGSIPLKAQHSLNLGLTYGKRLNFRISPFNSVAGLTFEYQHSLRKGSSLRFSSGVETTHTGLVKIDPAGKVLHLKNYWAIPVRIGWQKFFYDNKVFVFAEPGVVIGLFPQSETPMPTRVNLSYALGLGHQYHFKSRSYLQTSLSFNRNHYDQGIRFSWLSLRLAYGRKRGVGI